MNRLLGFYLLESRGLVGSGGSAGVNHGSSQIRSTSTALGPVVGHHRSSGASSQAQRAHQLQLRVGVRGEAVDGNNGRHPKLLDVLDVVNQIRATSLS